jgi:hypothetical protein
MLDLFCMKIGSVPMEILSQTYQGLFQRSIDDRLTGILEEQMRYKGEL